MEGGGSELIQNSKNLLLMKLVTVIVIASKQ